MANTYHVQVPAYLRSTRRQRGERNNDAEARQKARQANLGKSIIHAEIKEIKEMVDTEEIKGIEIIVVKICLQQYSLYIIHTYTPT